MDPPNFLDLIPITRQATLQALIIEEIAMEAIEIAAAELFSFKPPELPPHQFGLEFDSLELVKSCRLGKVETQQIDCSPYIQATPTSLGICSAFNPKSLALYHPSTFMSNFGRVYTPKMTQTPFLMSWTHMTLLLDVHNMEFADDQNTGSLTIGIQESVNNFDMTTNIFSIDPGERVYIKLKPTIHSAPEKVLAEKYEVKDCYSDTEWSDKGSILFKDGSSALCLVDCKLKLIQESFQCTPWDIPPVIDGLSRICNKTESKHFKNITVTKQISSECNCPTSCNSIEYKISLNKFQLNPKQECLDIEYFRFKLLN